LVALNALDCTAGPLPTIRLSVAPELEVNFAPARKQIQPRHYFDWREGWTTDLIYRLKRKCFEAPVPRVAGSVTRIGSR
jgi:hypothetical protein